MAFTKNVGRQYLLVAESGPINFGDLVSGVALPIIDLPPGATIQGGTVRTDTAFNSATSDTLNVGDAGSATRFVNANATVLRSADATTEFAATVPGYKNTAKSAVQVTWTGVGAVPTTGTFRVQVRYTVENKAFEVQT